MGRRSRHPVPATLLLVLAVACGGSGDNPAAPPTPAPTPMPTPEPAGSIRYVGATLDAGSTVEVAPLGDAGGQQAQQLSFTAAITMRQDLPNALVRAWVRTQAQRCMGGGRVGLAFPAGVEQVVEPASMSGPGPAGCVLPYTTTHVELEVLELDAQQTVLTQQFPAEYHFVAEP